MMQIMIRCLATWSYSVVTSSSHRSSSQHPRWSPFVVPRNQNALLNFLSAQCQIANVNPWETGKTDHGDHSRKRTHELFQFYAKLQACIKRSFPVIQCIAQCRALTTSSVSLFSLSPFALLSSECGPPPGFSSFCSSSVLHSSLLLGVCWGIYSNFLRKKLIYFCSIEWNINLCIILDMGVKIFIII